MSKDWPTKARESAWRGLTLAAAAAHRRVLRGVRLVGVTGSCGKTTTVNLVSAVLATCGPVRNGMRVERLGRAGDTGLTVLRGPWRRGHCVVELSGHAPGALRAACAWLRPEIGIVTHVRPDHYTNYRSLEATAAEKGRLVAALPGDGVAILNLDDPHVRDMRARTRARVIGIGSAEEAQVRLLGWQASWPDRLSLEVDCDGTPVTVATRFVDEVSAVPVLAALAAGLAAGVAPREAARAIAEVEPVAGRMCPHVLPDGVTVVDNAWKAPLYAMAPVLDFLRRARAGRKIAVIGSLSDFPGSKSPRYRQLAREALEVADVVIVVGRWAGSVERLREGEAAGRLLTFETLADCRAHLREDLRAGDLVMLAGSGTADHMERLLLDRIEPVSCWRERCGRLYRCEWCDLLRAAG